MDNNENVDFDFFDTPRNESVQTPKSPTKSIRSKPPAYVQNQHGDEAIGVQHREEKGKTTSWHINSNSSQEKKSSKYDSDDSYSSDTDSETPRNKRTPAKNGKGEDNSSTKNVNRSNDFSLTESSSAYSNSDYSSDESYERETKREVVKKEVIEVKMPNAHVQAWGDGDGRYDKRLKDNHNTDKKYQSQQDEKKSPRESRAQNDKRRNRDSQSSKKHSSSSNSSESDVSLDRNDRRNSRKYKKHERVISAKTKERNGDKHSRRPFKSTSSSHSNNSDITDVSPLDSPEISPRVVRKRTSSGSRDHGKYDDVQYTDIDSERHVDINLESDKIDLSILMKCMADIDKEKQQRLKTNSRKVMFAPPTSQDRQNAKANYTYSVGRAKSIEKENQRLLKQIMHHINPGAPKVKATSNGTRVPKKAVIQEPVIQRLTPSAVNRQRDQRRIEMENMHILGRLHTVRPTPGMSRTEQMSDFEKVASYGIPTGTLVVPGKTVHYNTAQRCNLQSSMSHASAGSTQRSRPSSAKSNASTIPGKRSRPSSAKSNASIRSNASVRSNASMRSTMSMRSNTSVRSGISTVAGRADNRPVWDDRFSFS